MGNSICILENAETRLWQDEVPTACSGFHARNGSIFAGPVSDRRVFHPEPAALRSDVRRLGRLWALHVRQVCSAYSNNTVPSVKNYQSTKMEGWVIMGQKSRACMKILCRTWVLYRRLRISSPHIAGRWRASGSPSSLRCLTSRWRSTRSGTRTG